VKSLIRIAFLLTATALTSVAADGGSGQVTVGAMVTEWDSATPLNPLQGIYPIGGAGQINGEFVIAERDGIQIGLRVTDRTDGLLMVSGKRTGTYRASTGYDAGTLDRAEWNYDWHIDLRGTGTELADYDLTLTQTFAPKLNGSAGPLDLKFPEIIGTVLDNAVLYQSSQNPVFFNDSFDVDKVGTYHLMLKLQPKKGGPPLIAQVKVLVADSP
jgi:hypothetical protein